MMYARISADSNNLKVTSDHSLATVRRATRDAFAELDDVYDSADDVYAVALPSARLDDE